MEYEILSKYVFSWVDNISTGTSVSGWLGNFYNTTYGSDIYYPYSPSNNYWSIGGYGDLIASNIFETTYTDTDVIARKLTTYSVVPFDTQDNQGVSI